MPRIYQKKTDKSGFPKNRLNFFFLFLLASVFSFPSFAQNYIVNSNTDANAVNLVTGDAGGGVITLRSAIQAATAQPGAHIITFSGAVATPINLTLGQITVGNAAAGNSISVNGPGMGLLTVNQTTDNRVFSTGTGAVTFVLQDITLNSTGPGAVPYSGGGGAIIAGGLGASTTLTNVTISNFDMQIGNGGAMSQSSSLNAHTLTITNCIFINNRCGGAGGAVSFNSQGGTATITGCTFTNNHTGVVGANTGGDGAAVSTTGGGAGGTYLIEKNTFLNNQVENVTGHAGAVMNTNGTLTLRYNRFIGNTCLNVAFPPLANIVGQAGGATTHVTIADNNWWAVNTGPGANDATALAAGAVMTLTKWLQLKTTASPNPICNTTPTTLGNSSTVTTSFLSNSASEAIAVSNLTVLIGLPVTWTSTLGSLSGQQVTIQAAGTATALFTSNGTAGTATVNAQVDNVPASEASPARANITVNATSIAPTGATGATTVCNGGTTTLTVSGGLKGTGAVTEWFTGSCGGTLVFTGDAFLTPSLITSTTYFVRYNGTCNITTCATVTVTVNDVSGGTVGSDQTFCSGGDPVAFTESVASTGSGALTYQWQSSTTSCAAGFSNIAGATGTTYDAPSGVTVTTYYRRVTTSTLNTVPCTANSNCITVTVNSVTGGTVVTDQTICSGGDPAAITQTVASTGTALTYQWQSSTTSCAAGFSDIAGATGTTYDPPSGLLVTTYYRRVTTSTLNSVVCTANSNCITVSVNDVTGGTVGSDQTIPSGGDPAAFTETVASNGSGTLTYQWQSSTTDCATGFSNIAAATGTTYDAAAGLLVTTYYRRVTTSTLNTVPCTANSNCITVTVNDVTGGTVAADQTICSGDDPAAFTETVPSTGSGTLTYQWQSSTTDCTTGFSNIAGATSTTYDPPAGLLVTTYYRRVTTSSVGPSSANSNCLTITVNPLPTTANAGPDQPLVCTAPGSTMMAGNVPAVGTGTWTQTGGPVPANLITPGAPNTAITGLTTPGTYTFRWTISNSPCPPSFDEMNVVVNSNPTAFTIGGAGTFCPTGTTLTGPVDPNYTYQWGRSLTATPYTNMGTAQTQAVTASGNYQLVVTNQFGCSTTATTTVHVADYVFNGSLAAGDAQQTGRINRFGVVSTCAAPKACPGIFTAVGARFYDAYTITNIRNTPVCATIGINSGCGTNIFNVAYLTSFNPAAPCTNYLGDPGSSFSASGFMEVTIPALGTIVVVVHEVNVGAGCANYQLTVDVPRETPGITVVPNAPPICSSAPVTLTASVANSYSWAPGGATTQAINVNPTVTTIYTATLGYGNNGCTEAPTATVTIEPLPTTANAGPDDAVCGLTYTLAGNTATTGTGTWTQTGGPGTSIFTNANSPTSGVTVTANGVYSFRWTIAVGPPCPNTSFDEVVVNFAGMPSTADAGPDRITCAVPGTVVMAAVAPAVGTGTWTQIAGPVTGVIISPNSNTTTINGLTTAGTYTFRWTISNAPCPSNFDDADVVVNPNPAAFTIGGGNVTVCPPGTTLSGPIDPNYTYQWSRSYTGSVGSFVNIAGATGQTYLATASGNYQLVVTNQFGCSTTATTTVHVADYVFNGSLAAGDAQQTGRINRFGVVSTCAAPKACPGIFTAVGARFYDAYTITNIRNTPVCATIGINSGCGTNIFNVAYLTSFNPAAPCTNYLGDPGSSFSASGFMEVTIPALGTIVVVVHEVNVGAGCANYQLTVDVPREAAAITVSPAATVCNGAPITLTASLANTYSWSPGGATTQSIVQSIFGTVNYTVTLGYGNTGCTASASQTVSVFPTPDATATPSSQTICSGNAITTIVLTGTVPATTFNWTRDNTVAVTGIAASGAGDISGSLTNTTNAPVTVTFTITPTANGCFGTPITATVLVNPTPNAVATPASQTVCSGTAITTIVLSGNVAGTTFNWTRDNTVTVTGIAASGSADISGTLTNATTSNVTVTFTITPTANGCTGAPITATVLVKPTPDVVAIPTSQTICSGAVAAINFTGNLGPVTTYNWTRDNTVAVTGLPASGSGNINAALTNTTNAPVTVTFTITPTFNGCTGASITATVLVNPTPNAVATPASQTICSAGNITTIVLTGAVAGTTYSWTRDNTVAVTGIAASGSGNISGALTNTTFAPVTVTFTITPTANGCTGAAITATVLVNPTPNAVATPPSQTVCSANPISTIVLSGAVAGTTFNWTRDNTVTVTGIAANGSGNISGTLTNTTNAPVTVTFTITPIANGCPGAAITATVLVNPTPNAVATPPSQTICSDATITTIVLTGAVSGTNFNWTRDNIVAVTGIAASGSGNISGTLTNTTNAPVTVTFTITPTANGCPGPSITATVLVNPTPDAVATPASQTICSANPITTIVLSGAVAGTTFNWTRNNTVTVTGIAASGSGNISGTLTNTTNAPVTVTFIITPTANGCPGAPITATVLVNPTPNAVAAPVSQTICSGTTITSILLSGAVAGTTFNWTRNNTVAVTGMPASGNGNISGSLTNTTNAPVTVTFTITPTANGCPGPSITATVLVNPLPNALATPPSQTICSGAAITTIVLTSAVAGTTYSWTRDNTINVTGIAASGNGNISGALTNTTFVPVLVTFTITPTANGCPGPSITATVLVNPTPDAFAFPAAQTVCSDNLIIPVILSGNVAGTVFNWTRNNTVTVPGIAASGSGNISGTLTNTTNAPILVTFIITAIANGCPGAPITATVLTYPTPSAVATPASQTICTGATITPIVITGPVAGTSFSWTRNNTGSVTGIPASGTGNISGSLTNITIAPVTVTFTITTIANGCVGSTTTATVVVNPTPTVTCPANIVVNAAAGTCSAIVNYPAATATGTPSPTITYSIASGSSFPVGVTTVTATATNICGTATCTFTITVVDVRPPVISTQPLNAAVCIGSSATFSVVATNVVSYQWQTGNANNQWGNIIGATASTYTISNTTMFMNNSIYRVALTGPCGTVVYSNVVTLVVNPLPVITLSSLSTPVLLPNRTVTITASGSPSGGSFVWLFNGVVMPGVTGSSLGPLTVLNVGTYTVIYTDPNGCVSTSLPFIVSVGITDFLWVYPNPNTGQFNVRFYNQSGEPATVKVFNGQGQEVYAQSVVLGLAYTNIQINMSNQAAGWYLVRVMNGSGAEMGSKRIFIYHP